MKKVYMKKLIWMFFSSLFTVGVNGQVLYEKTSSEGWTAKNVGADKVSAWDVNRNYGLGLFLARHNSASSSAIKHWAVSPVIELASESNFLEFEEIRNTETNNSSDYYVYIGPANANTDHLGEFALLERLTGSYPTWYKQVIDISAYNGEAIRIAIMRANERGATWEIRNFKVIGSNLKEVENFRATSVTSDNISLGWTAPENGGQVLLVGSDIDISGSPVNGQSYAVGSPVGNSTVLYRGLGSSHSDLNLGSFRSRFYKIWVFDPITYEYTKVGRSVDATTTGESTVFYEDFEGTNSLPPLWHIPLIWDSGKYNWKIASLNINSGDNWLMNGLETSYRGDKSAYVVPSQGQTTPGYQGNNGKLNWASFSTEVEIPEVYSSAELSFFWKAGGKEHISYGVVRVDDEVVSGQLVNQLTWKQEIIDISDYIGQTIKMEFYWRSDIASHNNAYPPGFCVDDVMITGKTIARPTAFTATVVNSSNVELSWTPNSQGYDVMIAYSQSGVFGSPNDGQAYDLDTPLPGGGEIIFKGNGSSYSHEINAGNRAYYRIWSVNQETNLYSTAVSASTVLPASLPFFDDFEEGFQWNTNANRNNNWYRGRAENNTLGGSYSAYGSNNNGFTPDFTDYWEQGPAVLELPVNLAGFKNVSLEFDWKLGIYNDNYINAVVEVLNGEDHIQKVNPTKMGLQRTWTSTPDGGWPVTNTSVFGPGSTLRFSMFANSGNGDLSFVIDNVKLTGELSPVENTPVAANEGQLENIITWQNIHESLEAVVIAFRGDVPVGVSLNSGERYYPGDIVAESGRVVYIGTGQQFIHNPVMGGQEYQYVVFQKNGLTYSEGKTSNKITTPETVTLFFEDFENYDGSWSINGITGINTWKIGVPNNPVGNGSIVAFVTNNDLDAGYSRSTNNSDNYRIVFSKSFEIDKLHVPNMAFSYDMRFDGRKGSHNSGSSYEERATVTISVGGRPTSKTYAAPNDNSGWDTKFEDIDMSWVTNETSDKVLVEIEFELFVGGYDKQGATQGLGLLLDNITLAAILDHDSRINAGATKSSVISSMAANQNNSVDVFEFKLADVGGDLRPSEVQQLTVSAGVGNTITNWRNALGGASLYRMDGVEEVFVADGLVQTQSILFEKENLILVPNGAEETFVLKVWANSNLVADLNGKKLQFALNSDDIVAYGGSSFKDVVSSALGGEVELIIQATELRFSQEPSYSANKNTPLPRQPIVVATDANGNVDNSFIGTISLSSDPEGVSGPLTLTAINGIAIFEGAQFLQPGQYTLSASTLGYPILTSDVITVSEIEGENLGGDSYIGAVRFAGIDSYTERGLSGYELLTDEVAYVTAGVSYELQVLANISSGENGFTLRVDVIDGVGTVVHNLCSRTGIGQSMVYGASLSISPDDLARGAYRLRVSLRNGANQGEVEDYTLIFTQAQWTGMYPAWDIRDNWSNRVIPSSDIHDVFIPSKPSLGGFFPVLSDSRDIKNLRIERDARLTMRPGSRLTINGDLIIDGPGGLIIENLTAKGGLASLITKGDVVGETNIKLTVPTNQWYYISSPVENTVFGNYGAGSPGATVYIERNNTWFTINGTHSDRELDYYEGLLVRYNPPTGDDFTLDYNGTVNTGDVVQAYDRRKYYLFGNPYPSAIDWDEVSTINMEQVIWYRTRIGSEMVFVNYHRGSKEYNVFPGELEDEFNSADPAKELAIIPPYQAVWVRPVTNVGGSISLNNANRTHGVDASTGISLKSSGSRPHKDAIRIVAANEYTRDGTVIYFSKDGIDGVGQEDAEKYFNSSEKVPEIYTRVGNVPLAINGLPRLNEGTRVLPISVRNRVKGEVKLHFNMRDYYGHHSVYLEDRDTGAFVNLLQSASYAYNVEDVGERHDRFVLHFYYITTDLEPEIEDPQTASGINITGVAGKALVSVQSELLQLGEPLIEIFRIDGSKISEMTARSSRTFVLLPRTSEVFIIRVSIDDLVKSERVLGQK